MTTHALPVQPDIVKMVVGFLRVQAEVTALIPANQIRGQLGNRPTFPLARVTRITDVALVAVPPILDRVTVQIDVWGGNNRQAERIAATMKAALVWRGTGYVNDEGVITGVDTAGLSNIPDDDFDPPRQRYVLDIDVYTRTLYSTV